MAINFHCSPNLASPGGEASAPSPELPVIFRGHGSRSPRLGLANLNEIGPSLRLSSWLLLDNVICLHVVHILVKRLPKVGLWCAS